MTFRFFKWMNPGREAEDMGYDCGWLGLDNANPFTPGSINHKSYEWGFAQALDDIDEWKDAYYPSDEYETHWPN